MDLPSIPIFDIPAPRSTEEILASRSERFAGPFQALRSQREHAAMFPAVSLAGWMQAANAAGIDHVPSKVIAVMPVGAIIAFEEDRPQDAKHWAALQQAQAAVLPNEMLRWDCCACLDMKLRMHDGLAEASTLDTRSSVNPNVPEWRIALSPDDPRFADIVYVYPGDDVPVHKRPWIEAREEGTHPAEYRVFVKNGVIEGLANYYVQRDMAMNDTVHDEIVQCLGAAQRLVYHLAREGAIPYNQPADKLPTDFEFNRVSCTLDFLVAKDGRVMFLEAGPPFGLGAHPCAFMEHADKDGVLRTEGVALAVGQAPEPISGFLEEARAMAARTIAPRP